MKIVLGIFSGADFEYSWVCCYTSSFVCATICATACFVPAASAVSPDAGRIRDPLS